LAPVKRRAGLEELLPVGLKLGAQLIEDLDWQSDGIGGSLQHELGNSADEDRFRDPLGAVASDVACHFSSASGVADVNGIGNAEMLGERCQVVGVGVQIVGLPRLRQAAMASTVMRDRRVSLVSQREHLVLEGIGTQRPAMLKTMG